MKILSFVLLGLLAINLAAEPASENVTDIKAYHQVSDLLASSGSVKIGDLPALKAAGFKHIVGLVPGDYSALAQAAKSHGMTYHHIPVEWKNPQLSEFQQMVEAIGPDNAEKTLIHCKLNWRASSFTYLYRVTQLGISEQQAEKDLQKIWNPHQGWDTFIDQVKQHYKKP